MEKLGVLFFKLTKGQNSERLHSIYQRRRSVKFQEF